MLGVLKAIGIALVVGLGLWMFAAIVFSGEHSWGAYAYLVVLLLVFASRIAGYYNMVKRSRDGLGTSGG